MFCLCVAPVLNNCNRTVVSEKLPHTGTTETSEVGNLAVSHFGSLRASNWSAVLSCIVWLFPQTSDLYRSSGLLSFALRMCSDLAVSEGGCAGFLKRRAVVVEYWSFLSPESGSNCPNWVLFMWEIDSCLFSYLFLSRSISCLKFLVLDKDSCLLWPLAPCSLSGALKV